MGWSDGKDFKRTAVLAKDSHSDSSIHLFCQKCITPVPPDLVTSIVLCGK